MKVNKFIGSIATLAVAMIVSVSNAQVTIDPAVPVASAVPLPTAEDTVVQEAVVYDFGQVEGSMVVGEQVMPAQPSFEYEPEVVGSGCCMPAPVVGSCDCSKKSCSKCRRSRGRRACGCRRRDCGGGCQVAAKPTSMFKTCEGDFCKLSVKQGKETKSCFTTDQETICIPAVRLPWQDCCPPSKSKTRLVTRLKTKKNEVEACSYKWSVEETNHCGADAPANVTSEDVAPEAAEPAEQTSEGTVETNPVAEPAETPEAVKEAFEENVVPPAPKVKGAFLKAFRQR